jgi:hypothetical protein
MDTRNSCLNVLLMSAKDLASADVGSDSDPYVTLQLVGGEITEAPLKSKTIQDCNGPCYSVTVAVAVITFITMPILMLDYMCMPFCLLPICRFSATCDFVDPLHHQIPLGTTTFN